MVTAAGGPGNALNLSFMLLTHCAGNKTAAPNAERPSPCLKETKHNAGYSGAVIPDSTDWSLTNNPYRSACYHSHTGDQLRTLGYCVIFGEL